MIIKHSKLAEHNLLIKLASHFKVTKEEINKAKSYLLSGNERVESPILSLDYLPNGININDLFYPVEVNGLNLTTLVDHSKFIKSKLYEAFTEAEGYLDPHRVGRLKMSIYLTGMVWVIYRESSYQGVGGIFICGNDWAGSEGFVIEPLKNYLNYHWPKPEVD
jgi:hypothetical protein